MNIALYLTRDAAARWKEQPHAPLARFTVAFLVCALSLTILSVLGVAERVLEARLADSGVNAVAIMSPLMGATAPENGERFAALGDFGESLALVKLHRVATADFGGKVVVYGYHESALGTLATHTTEPRIFIGNILPGMEISATVDDREMKAVSVAKAGVLRRIPVDTGMTGAILVPLSDVADMVGAEGGVEVNVLERSASAPTVPEIVGMVERTAEADDLHLTTLSADGMIRELDTLQGRRAQIQAMLALGVAVAVAVVFGALSMLEYRENRHVCALLRSMGIRAGLLAGQSLAEGLVVALLAAGAACAIVPAIARFAAGQGWLDGTVAASVPAVAFSPGVIWPVMAALITGAIVATAPVALAMRKPVGHILN